MSTATAIEYGLIAALITFAIIAGWYTINTGKKTNPPPVIEQTTVKP